MKTRQKMNKKEKGKETIKKVSHSNKIQQAKGEHFKKIEDILIYLQDEDSWANNPVEQLFSCYEKLKVLDDVFRIEIEDSQSSHTENLQYLKNWVEKSRKSIKSTEVDSSQAASSTWMFYRHPNEFVGSGIVCTRDIVKGEHVITIPRAIMLSAQFGRGRVKSMIPLLDSMEDNSVLQLATCLMYHKLNEETSYFSQYLKTLPQSFNLPTYWDRSIFEALSTTPTTSRSVKSVRAAIILFIRLIRSVETFKNSDFAIDKITWDTFKWCLGVVVSRQNNVPLTRDSNAESALTLALVPAWDMMNHECGEMTTGFDFLNDCLRFEAMRDFKVGEELTMCYGQRQNELFLMYSGFAVQDSPYEAFDFEVVVPIDDIGKIRELVLRNNGITLGKGSGSGSGSAVVSISRSQGEVLLTKEAMVIALACVMTRGDSVALMRCIASCNTVEGLLALSSGAEGMSHAIKVKALELLEKYVEGCIAGINVALEKVKLLKSNKCVSDIGSDNMSSKTEEVSSLSQGMSTLALEDVSVALMAQNSVLDSCEIMLHGQRILLEQFLGHVSIIKSTIVTSSTIVPSSIV